MSPGLDLAEPRHDRDSLLAWMTANGVAQTTHEHPAVFRVEEGLDLKAGLPGLHTKNLLLKDKKSRLWLISAAQDTVIDLNRVPALIGAPPGTGRFSFASPERMMQTLGVRPGSVTALGLINDVGRQVRFVLDRRLHEAERVNFHPLVNTATTALDQAAFRRFLSLIERAPIVADFAT